MIIVSYMTTEPDYGRIGSLTYETATEADRRRTRVGWDWRDVAASGLVLAFIFAAYLYFRG
jgi:hypothetical protein